MDAPQMIRALESLDRLITRPLTLILGGGGAMLLAYKFPLATQDLDAYPKGMELSELDPLIKKVAQELDLSPDWLNPYFSTFAFTLPSDYGDRLVEVFHGKWLKTMALGREDLLIMKCFAHRPKDVGHAKTLVKQKANLAFVDNHLQVLLEKNIPGTQQAIDFFNDVCDL
jgi:hypothetical protein